MLVAGLVIFHGLEWRIIDTLLRELHGRDGRASNGNTACTSMLLHCIGVFVDYRMGQFCCMWETKAALHLLL